MGHKHLRIANKGLSRIFRGISLSLIKSNGFSRQPFQNSLYYHARPDAITSRGRGKKYNERTCEDGMLSELAEAKLKVNYVYLTVGNPSLEIRSCDSEENGSRPSFA